MIWNWSKTKLLKGAANNPRLMTWEGIFIIKKLSHGKNLICKITNIGYNKEKDPILILITNDEDISKAYN